MQIFRFSYTSIPCLPHSVLAAGFFDGFHQGHRALLTEAKKQAERLGLLWGVLTFDPDPWAVFRPGEPLEHIQSLEDRERTAEALGANLFCILDFTRAFASLSPDGFHQVLKDMHVDYLVTGFDFRYGARNAGSVQSLTKAGFAHSVVQAVTDLDGKISSTRIEEAVRGGNVEAAAAMLGQDYSVPGLIVHGFGRGGKLLGFPTANLQPDPGYLLPARGVYAGFVQTDSGIHEAMISVGVNPTFTGAGQTVEAFLFDFDSDLYGQRVRFYFSRRLRPEKRFDGPAALKSQLVKDEAQSRQVLDGHDPDPDGVYATAESRQGVCRDRGRDKDMACGIK